MQYADSFFEAKKTRTETKRMGERGWYGMRSHTDTRISFGRIHRKIRKKTRRRRSRSRNQAMAFGYTRFPKRKSIDEQLNGLTGEFDTVPFVHGNCTLTQK